MNSLYVAICVLLKRFCYFSLALIAEANAYVVVNYHTSTCAGSEVSCRGNSLNSVGDLVVWDTKGAPLIGYGEINDETKTKSISANIPKSFMGTKSSQKLILSFIPKNVSDSIKGSMIRVLFVFIPLKDVDQMDLPATVMHDIQDLQTKDQTAKTVISVYRQIIAPKSVSNNSEWINVATLGTMAKLEDIKRIKADLSPDGIATVFTKDIDGKDVPTIINLAREY